LRFRYIEYPDDADNADDDVYLTGNGIISLTEPFSLNNDLSSYPPAIAPFLILDDGFDPGDPIQTNVLNRPSVFGGDSDSFFRYAYNTEVDAPPDPFSATLYVNEESQESDWIVFSYGSDGYDEYNAFVGLIPGDGGSDDHPGPGEPRGRLPDDWLHLSIQRGDSIEGDEYLWLAQQFEERTFDLEDTFLVFRPDGDNKYKIIAGTRDMVVDSLGLDGESTSLDMAVVNAFDSDLLDRIDKDEFKPGDFNIEGEWSGEGEDTVFTYWPSDSYGLQTVGQDDGVPTLFTAADDTLARINDSNGFLAYAVQVEEDRLNEQIIEMAHDSYAMKARVAGYKAKGYGEIRARDAALLQMADAQSGRVTKDHNGNWVRAQQYIFRHNDEGSGKTSVQLVNVCLRNNSSVSAMEFRTDFTGLVDDKLTDLPWEYWLDTKPDVTVGDRLVADNDNGTAQRFVFARNGSPELESMSVTFTNPVQESLQESRSFGPQIKGAPFWVQNITKDTLTLSTEPQPFTYGTGYTVDSINPTHFGGFDYVLGDGSRIDVAFYNADNTGGRDAQQTGGFQDMWDALRVSEPVGFGTDTRPNIGDNNLEIAIGQNSGPFSQPIDVIYIPMSRMLWKGIGGGTG